MSLEIVLVIVVALLLVCFFVLAKFFLDLKSAYNSLLFDKRSLSVKYGQLTEQWIPFSEKFPYNSQNFRFIGKPIDGIAFEDDKIVFVEFKSNKSSLSESQKRVRDLVEKKRVEWFELKAD
jgi:predicted Holliday junction resolvase-like endonuclease